MRYNKLTIIEETIDINTKYNRKMVICKCDCGNIITTRLSSVKSGNTKSCGCYKNEITKKIGLNNKKHGMSFSKEHNSWKSMKDRCLNTNHIFYKNYGGRGIKVCDRWINSFENFYQDMGKRPLGKTLDRINVNGNYEPSNCRWATIEEQNKNKS